MNRRDYLKAVGAVAPVAALGGCATRQAVHSEVQAVAQVTEVERHDGAVTAHIEVISDDPEDGSVGLHVHYFHDGCGGHDYHTHLPTVFVPSGEVVEVRDTYEHDRAVECVTAHVHD
jgi:hypothetical protein